MASDIIIAVGLFTLLLIAMEIGFRAGQRASKGSDVPAGGQVGSIQGALLGLLGLLLAFSFAAAGSRFLERQDLITEEANAIGTSTLRADLLAEPHRTNLRTALRDYTAERIELSAGLRDGLTSGDLADIDRSHRRIWAAAMAGVNDRPHMVLSVLPPINDVIDLHSTRLAAGRKRLPTLITGVLLSCSLLAIGVMGYGSGLYGRKRLAPLTLSLTAIVAAALWITYDLDNPRAGLLQLNDAPLRALTFGDP